MAAEAEVIRFLLLPLEKEMTDYMNLKAGAQEEFKQLNGGLILLEAFLKDEAKKTEKEEVRKEIERQIRELVYDVEDTIEIYLAKMAAAETKNVISRFFGKFNVNLDKRVKTLNERVKPIVDEIKREFGEMKTGPRPSQEPLSQRTKHDELQKLDKVVGFEDEKTITAYLKCPKDKLDVISITGMTGLGKSTLAWKIYHNEEIVKEFKFRIWIHVSQNFNRRDAFLKILRKANPKQTSSPTDEEELISTVRACLENNKFLLIFDDVWSTEDWDAINQILPADANCNGKVLVSSREEVVGVHASTCGVPHKLSFLNAEKSWELLQLIVFGDLQGCPQKLRDIGKSIASHCGGVPLTIVVIGGYLREQLATTRALEHDEWVKVLRDVNEISVLDDKSKRILKAIELSYDRLPNELRACFLYMGVFPENEEIPASVLTQLWIAEGFIRPEDRKSFEETAHKILNDLIKMNLLMVGKIHLDGVKTCRVPDMIRHFCISKAKEENLFRVMKESEGGEIKPPVSELRGFHRLSLHSDLNTFLSKKPKGPRVRSFLCFCKEAVHMKEKHKRALPQAFSLLRVLNCNSIKFGQFPNLTKLLLLKHITLFIDDLEVLPQKISLLLNLQTLLVETKSSSSIIKVKANIWKMTKLRHVKTKAVMLLVDKKWKADQADGNLQTLTRLSPESCTTLAERASRLKMLGVQGKLTDFFSSISLQDFCLLEKLKLVNAPVDEPASKCPLLNLPQSNYFPLSLKNLTLSNTYLDWKQHMPILANISTLEVLKLKNAFFGISWQAEGDGFQSLQFLLVADTELIHWKASTTQFPCLRWLKLRKCKKLVGIPGELAAKLEKLEIEHVHQTAVDSAKRIEKAKKQAEDKQSILEVPFTLTIGPGCN